MAKPYLNGHILAALDLRLLTNQAAKWVTFRQKRKHFFFEKKKQKTFEFLNALIQAKETQETKVLVLFFKPDVPVTRSPMDQRPVPREVCTIAATQRRRQSSASTRPAGTYMRSYVSLPAGVVPKCLMPNIDGDGAVNGDANLGVGDVL